MKYENLDSEFENTNITINDSSVKVQSQAQVKPSNSPSTIISQSNPVSNSKETEKTSSKEGIISSLFKSKKKEIAMGLISSAKDKSKNWYEKLICNFSYLDPYFKVDNQEIKRKLLQAFVPFSSSFVNENPDYYGPFWIYTTLIFLISAVSSLNSIINLSNNKENYVSFVENIPKAAFFVSRLYCNICIYVYILCYILISYV